MTEAVGEKKGKPKKLPLPVKLVVGAIAGGEISLSGKKSMLIKF